MKWLINIIRTNKYAVYWTIAYVFVMWAVMRFMFNFGLFSAADWHRLIHAHLRGFPGFVFGIFVLAALPMYVATTAVIIRTKRALITIPTPKIFARIFTPTRDTIPETQPAPAPEPQHDDTLVAVIDNTAPDSEPMPDKLPTELRPVFRRARQLVHMPITPYGNNTNIPTKSFESTTGALPESDTATTDDLPLPSDFDTIINDSNFSPMPDFSTTTAPAFRDIDFDTTTDTTEPAQPDENDVIIKYLNAQNKEYKIIDDIVVTDKYAIASHTDSEFWIADNDTWFAAGRTRQSPIATAIRIANANNLTPIIYLGADNIMNIDTVRGEWQSSGVMVVTDPSDIVL
ncbi:MAG: hypothetical protein IJ560_03375 [Alphaproteobacteria bacterium]|nr:hypothetical protein [Alphaproteobacteria bacterium]